LMKVDVPLNALTFYATIYPMFNFDFLESIQQYGDFL